MSASTRDETLKLNSGRKVSVFWMISIGLHAAVIGAVLFIAPVREIVLMRERPKEPEIITRGDELQKIIEDIRDLTAERLRARVEILHAGQDRMATNFDTLNKYFQPFQDQQQASALDRLKRYADETLKRQQTVLDALTAARDRKQHAEAARIAHENLSRILTGQDEIRRGIQLLKFDNEALMASQRKAEELQHQASQFVRWMDDNVDSIERETKRVAEERAKAEEAKPQVETLQKTVQELEGKRIAFDAQRRALEQEKNDADAKRREFDRAKDRESAKAQAAMVEELQKQIRETSVAHDKARNEANEKKRELDRAENQYKSATEQMELAQKRLDESTAKRDELTLTGINVQGAARQNQQEVLAAVLKQNGGTQ